MAKNGSLIASEILIVDDEEDIRDLISGILADEGYATRVAGDSDSWFRHEFALFSSPCAVHLRVRFVCGRSRE